MAYVQAGSCSFTKEQLAIAITSGAFGSHVGIAFHSVKEGLRLLHLARHQCLMDDDFSRQDINSRYVAAVVDIPPAASKQMVSIIRSVAKRQPRINYGINAKAAVGSFDNSGRYKPPKGSDGLTCATFVSTVFSDYKVPLIDLDTWEPNQENELWGRKVCAFLKQCKVDESHLKAVESNISGLRVRPEEVAAAADAPASFKPVAYSVAKERAPAVLDALQSIGS